MSRLFSVRSGLVERFEGRVRERNVYCRSAEPSRAEPSSKRSRLRRRRITRWFRLELVYFKPETRRGNHVLTQLRSTSQSDCLLCLRERFSALVRSRTNIQAPLIERKRSNRGEKRNCKKEIQRQEGEKRKEFSWNNNNKVEKEGNRKEREIRLHLCERRCWREACSNSLFTELPLFVGGSNFF